MMEQHHPPQQLPPQLQHLQQQQKGTKTTRLGGRTTASSAQQQPPQQQQRQAQQRQQRQQQQQQQAPPSQAQPHSSHHHHHHQRQPQQQPFKLSIQYGSQTLNKIESVERNRKMNLVLSCEEQKALLAHARVEISPMIVADNSDWTMRSKKLLPSTPSPPIRGRHYRLEVLVRNGEGEEVGMCHYCLKGKQNQSQSFVRVRCPFVDARKNGFIRLPVKFPCLPSHQEGGVPKQLWAEFRLINLNSPSGGGGEWLEFYVCVPLQFRTHSQSGSNSSSSSREAPEPSPHTSMCVPLEVQKLLKQQINTDVNNGNLEDSVMELSNSPPIVSPVSDLMEDLGDNSPEGSPDDFVKSPSSTTSSNNYSANTAITITSSDSGANGGGLILSSNANANAANVNHSEQFGWNLFQELTVEALRRENKELKSRLTERDDELSSTKKALALVEIEHRLMIERLERKERELREQMRILEEMEKRMKQMHLSQQERYSGGQQSLYSPSSSTSSSSSSQHSPHTHTLVRTQSPKRLSPFADHSDPEAERRRLRSQLSQPTLNHHLQQQQQLQQQQLQMYQQLHQLQQQSPQHQHSLHLLHQQSQSLNGIAGGAGAGGGGGGATTTTSSSSSTPVLQHSLSTDSIGRYFQSATSPPPSPFFTNFFQ